MFRSGMVFRGGDGVKHKIICGHIIPALETLPDEHVDMLMTSVPYWGLRDYGGDTASDWQDGWHGQLGLEPTPELYIKHLHMVFAEVKRVLKKTGTCWVNIGDTYAGSGCGKNDYSNNNKRSASNPMLYCDKPSPQLNIDLPDKCMIMIPERFAFMMLDLGYILRNKIIWHKPNPMPSSVKDRFNTTYEMLYFFSKSRKYWFDLDAVREEHKPESLKRVQGNWNGHREPMSSFQGMDIKKMCSPSGKNPGDFWSINTQPFPEAHFAVFPEKLCEKPILAGCPAEVCKYCRMARMRITEQGDLIAINERGLSGGGTKWDRKKHGDTKADEWQGKPGRAYENKTIGWTDCQCEGEDKYEPGIILDPFAGSGTVGIIAEKLNRNSILIDIKKEYCEMALKRLKPLIEQTKLTGEQSTITRTGF